MPLAWEWAVVTTTTRDGYLYSYELPVDASGCRLPAGRVYSFLFWEREELVTNYDLVRVCRSGGRRFAHLLNGQGTVWLDSLPLERDDKLSIEKVYAPGTPVAVRICIYLSGGCRAIGRP